ncbi:hypothetical protein R6Q57_022002 [Mikania cordata]
MLIGLPKTQTELTEQDERNLGKNTHGNHSSRICERIEQYNREVKIVNTGTVLQVGDGIARIHGLDEVMADELVEFHEGIIGIALNLESTNIGVVLMGDDLKRKEKKKSQTQR